MTTTTAAPTSATDDPLVQFYAHLVSKIDPIQGMKFKTAFAQQNFNGLYQVYDVIEQKDPVLAKELLGVLVPRYIETI